MLIDSSLEIGDATAFTVAVATAKQGSAINLRALIADNATIDLSAGEPLYVVIEITDTVTSDGSATMNLQLVTATNDALSGSPVNIWETGVEVFGYFAAGKRYIINLPKADYKAYLGLKTTVGTAVITAGSFNAFITKDVANWSSTNTRTD